MTESETDGAGGLRERGPWASSGVRFVAVLVALAFAAWVPIALLSDRGPLPGEELVSPSPEVIAAEARRDRSARNALRIRRLQLDVAEGQLALMGIALEVGFRTAEIPAGVHEFVALTDRLGLDAELDALDALDAFDALVALGPRASGDQSVGSWTALLRLDSVDTDDSVFDRVLRTRDGSLYLGWTPERGVGVSVMSSSELPARASDFVAATESGDVHWCSLEEYRRENSYDPDATGAVWDDAAAFRALWVEAYETAGRDATVTAARGPVPELVVDDRVPDPAWYDQPFKAGYAPATNTVYVRPRIVRRDAALSGLDCVADREFWRILLIHEAVHAHDFRTSSQLLAGVHSDDAEWVRVALLVAEGHAELVAQRAAARLGLSDTWGRFGRAARRGVMVTAAEGVEGGGADAHEIHETGHALMSRVLERGGPEAVRELVAHPPVTEAELPAE